MKRIPDHLSKQTRWKLKKLAEGKCTQCGKPMDGPYKRLCVECNLKQREARRHRLGSERVNRRYDDAQPVENMEASHPSLSEDCER